MFDIVTSCGLEAFFTEKHRCSDKALVGGQGVFVCSVIVFHLFNLKLHMS